MKARLALIAAFVLVISSIAVAQTPQSESPEPSPTPKPPVKRRTFDQFDLSNGIGGGLSSSNRVGPASTPAVTELVDQGTYDGIAQMVKYAAQIESEYRSTDGVTIDRADYFEPYRVLSRKLPALYRIMEMFRAGLLEQPVLTNPANVALLNQNQQILAETQMIANSTDAQFARNQPKLLPIAERYGAPTYPVEKRPLLTAMFVRLNGNFSRLIGQVAVRK
jgi:hypothetical protein